MSKTILNDSDYTVQFIIYTLMELQNQRFKLCHNRFIQEYKLFVNCAVLREADFKTLTFL